MILFIPPAELEAEFVENWKLGFIRDPHIDYATNCIHAWFEEKEIILYKFIEYGWINDNRYNSYKISAGSAGIVIEIKKND